MSIWTEKYRPKTTNEFIGQNKAITIGRQWLKEYKAGKTKKKFLFLVGGSGIGKTTLAHLLLKEAGYEIMEYIASNIKESKQIKEILSKATQQCNIIDMLNGKLQTSGIIIDEIDTISMGVKEFVSYVNGIDGFSPIICTTHNQVSKSITSYKVIIEEIRMNQPTQTDMENLINHIVSKENIKIPRESYFIIINNAQKDMRRLVQLLFDIHMLSNNTSLKDDLSHEDIIKIMDTHSKKDVDTQILDGAHQILYDNLNLNEIENLYNIDCIIMPQIVQENYYKVIINRKCNAKKKLELMAKIADNYLDYEDILRMIYQNQDWTLQNLASFFSCGQTNINIKTELPPHDNISGSATLNYSSTMSKLSRFKKTSKSIIELTEKYGHNKEEWMMISEYITYIMNHNKTTALNKKSLLDKILLDLKIHNNDLPLIISLNQLNEDN